MPSLRAAVAENAAVTTQPDVTVKMISDALVTVPRNGIMVKTVVLEEAWG